MDLSVLAGPACVRAGESAFLQVVAENTGAKLWDGAFRLGTRWEALDSEGDLPAFEGRLFMVPWLKVPTGSGVVFEGLVQAPSEPGFYKLKLGMVEELVAGLGNARRLYRSWGPLNEERARASLDRRAGDRPQVSLAPLPPVTSKNIQAPGFPHTAQATHISWLGTGDCGAAWSRRSDSN